MEMRKGAQLAPAKPTLGTIKSIDSAAHTVVLDSGKTCHCATTVDLAKFKAGDKVSMTFAESLGIPECTTMTRAA